MNNYFITLQKLSKTFILVVFKPQPTKQLIYSCERVLKKTIKNWSFGGHFFNKVGLDAFKIINNG